VRARFAPGRLASAGPVCERSAAGSPA